ncbi:hypothetical protein UlMin_045270 [Ulmus minor]
MFTKVFQKPTQQSPEGSLTSPDFNPRVVLHYGIPSTASILALDPIQSLLAIGTLDGRIKVIGAHNVEGFLISPKQLPFKNLEFLQNQGFLASVSSDNEIQVWDLENRIITSTLQWESNITAFSVIDGSSYMYIGSEHGIVYVLKYEAENGKIIHLPYYVTTNVIADAAGMSLPDHLSVVGVLHQPCSQGNRMLIAYENGLIILWDASQDRVVLVRGSKDLQLMDETVVDCVKGTQNELRDSLPSDHKEMEKEISSLCWASEDGSILAVGYVDGDIMFWDLSDHTSSRNQIAKNVVKLQLSSGNRRLPVIVLHWSGCRSRNHHGGQLFVYGGDQIGSEEVLTVLSLEWSQGIKSLKCISRIDLTLNGSFADMILLPHAGPMDSNETMLFMLTNPGQLHVYDDASLSASASQQKKTPISATQYNMIIPTIEPNMTVSKLVLLQRDGDSSRALSKIALAQKIDEAHSPTGGTKWPLTGGVPSRFNAEDYQVERVYVSGYQDGSVCIWDVTCPVPSLINTIGPEDKDTKVAGETASVSALDFCTSSLKLAIGDQCGVIRLSELKGSGGEKNLYCVTETGNQVYSVQQGDVPNRISLFSIVNSPICTLQFANSRNRLAVGFESGQVAMLDISAFSVLFLMDVESATSSPVNSLYVRSISDTNSLIESPKNSQSTTPEAYEKEVVFIMTRNAHIIVRDSTTGNLISLLRPKKEATAISMYLIEDGDCTTEVLDEKNSLNSPHISEAKNEHTQANTHSRSNQLEVEPVPSTRGGSFGIKNITILLCCEDAVHLYSLNSVMKGEYDSIQKVDLVKPCCWTTMLKKDEKEAGLVLLYQTGVIEIRSLSNLEVLVESSLMSLLRWNFKTNMDKTICSSDHGQIALVNGCELAFVSLLAHENDFRIPDSLPCLHDTVIAAAADAAYSLSTSQKEAESTGIIGNIVKNLKKEKGEDNVDLTQVHKNNFAHLDSLFSSPPFLKPFTTAEDDQEILELNLDDIVIDEPVHVSSSSQKIKNEKKDKGTERERLFDGATTDSKPKSRTPEEIRAKYRKAGDASEAASLARDKLVQRQEKLERLSQSTEELKSGSENFASMAKELAKSMENRKWWHI